MDASEALLSLESDSVTFLKSHDDPPKQPKETETTQKRNSNLEYSWNNIDLSTEYATNEDLPFFSQLTQNAETGSVDLRDDANESTTVATAPQRNNASLAQTDRDRRRVLLDMKETLGGQNEFNNCTFTFNFGRN